MPDFAQPSMILRTCRRLISAHCPKSAGAGCSPSFPMSEQGSAPLCRQRHGRRRGELARSLKDDTGSALHQILFSRNGGNAGGALIVGGLTAGDILYDAVAIDPTVLRAADFSRSDDISNIFDFGIFADRIGSMAAESEDGAGNNLRGYVAEQIVATRLVEQGHVVSFPSTANNSGFDLLVDGHAFQVKCLASIAGLREHFEKYPDMPVFANGELAEAVAAAAEGWAGKVFYVEGFDRETADFIMQTALDAGASLGEMDVPYFAVAVSTAKNSVRLVAGKNSARRPAIFGRTGRRCKRWACRCRRNSPAMSSACCCSVPQVRLSSAA